MRGYFEIGIYQPKREVNVGTLWRTAYQLGAAGIFTIGARYRPQISDTLKSDRHIPLRFYQDFDDFYSHIPNDCTLAAIEQGGLTLGGFRHPQRCIYLLGAEDGGLPQDILKKCKLTISLQSINTNSYNVAISGSLIMYDRVFGFRS